MPATGTRRQPHSGGRSRTGSRRQPKGDGGPGCHRDDRFGGRCLPARCVDLRVRPAGTDAADELRRTGPRSLGAGLSSRGSALAPRHGADARRGIGGRTPIHRSAPRWQRLGVVGARIATVELRAAFGMWSRPRLWTAPGARRSCVGALGCLLDREAPGGVRARRPASRGLPRRRACRPVRGEGPRQDVPERATPRSVNPGSTARRRGTLRSPRATPAVARPFQDVEQVWTTIGESPSGRPPMRACRRVVGEVRLRSMTSQPSGSSRRARVGDARLVADREHGAAGDSLRVC